MGRNASGQFWSEFPDQRQQASFKRPVLMAIAPTKPGAGAKALSDQSEAACVSPLILKRRAG